MAESPTNSFLSPSSGPGPSPASGSNIRPVDVDPNSNYQDLANGPPPPLSDANSEKRDVSPPSAANSTNRDNSNSPSAANSEKLDVSPLPSAANSKKLNVSPLSAANSKKLDVSPLPSATNSKKRDNSNAPPAQTFFAATAPLPDTNSNNATGNEKKNLDTNRSEPQKKAKKLVNSNAPPAQNFFAAEAPFVPTAPPPDTNSNNATGNEKKAATTGGIAIQWVLLVLLSAIPIAIYNFAPAYGLTIVNAFFTTLGIVGGLLCLIAAVSIMMNIYKTDGTPIMIMMGLLGAIASPIIVIGYWIYHVWTWTQSRAPRPYFGLFPIGFRFDNSFLDSIVAPFHDSSTDKAYNSLLSIAHRNLYGGD